MERPDWRIAVCGLGGDGEAKLTVPFNDPRAIVEAVKNLTDLQKLAFVDCLASVSDGLSAYPTSPRQDDAERALQLTRDGTVSSDELERYVAASPTFDEWAEVRLLEAENALRAMVWAIEEPGREDLLVKLGPAYAWLARAAT